MKREEALRELLAKGDGAILLREKAFHERLYERRQELAKQFREILARLVQKKQKTGKDCRYVYCSLLRVDLLKGKYLVLIQAVGEGYALDPDPLEEWMDLGEYFGELESVRKELMDSLPGFIGKVNSWDVQNLIAARAMKWFGEIGYYIRFLLEKEENQAEIMALIPADVPRIVRWGEYRDQGETIFFYDERPDQEGRLKALLKQSFSYPYILQARHLRQGEYEGIGLERKRLEFLTFEDCEFRGVSFSGSDLWGARFRNCRFRRCSFREGDLTMARFENCSFEDMDWAGTQFSHTLCFPELPLGVSEAQRSEILAEEEQYDAAIFLYGAGQDHSGHGSSGEF